MKVILATTFVPFMKGGADLIVDWLDAALARQGHEVEVFRFPFAPHYREMLDQMLAVRLLDLSERGDRLVCIRTPSYLLSHPNKVLWFIHHYRAAYDLWGTPFGDMPDGVESRRYRDAFRNADNLAFSEARRIFTNSRVVSNRLKTFNGIDAEVLYPPLLDPQRFRCGPYGDYALYVSRLVPHKRQDLVIEALAHTQTPVRLVLAGPAGSAEYVKELGALVAKHGLGNRVTIMAGWIPEEKKIELVSGCLAGVYTPFDEDSYGYAALEMQHAGKAVITTTDSGGPLELIVDQENGIVCKPNPKAIAGALDDLYENRERTAKMGQSGPARIAAIGAGWDQVVRKLLA
jgi:glycosyltransferase involved in cell wall biosynthesis